MTREVDPATLVAHLDGELKASLAREVEASLAAEPKLRAQFFALQRVDAALGAAFDPILEEPLPALALTGRQPTMSNRRQYFARTAPWLALAAGVGGLILGFTVGQISSSILPGNEPVAVAAIEAQLPEILETGLSGTTVAFNDVAQGVSGTVRPVSTFVNADGSYCRAYEAQAEDEQGRMTSRGVACRDNEGHWLTRVQVNAV